MSFLPVYNRAGLSRTVTLVVALSLTAVSTGAIARALDAAATNSAIDLDRGNGATIASEIPVSLEPRGLPGLTSYDSAARSIAGSGRFEAAIAGNHASHSAIPRRRGRSNELA